MLKVRFKDVTFPEHELDVIRVAQLWPSDCIVSVQETPHRIKGDDEAGEKYDTAETAELTLQLEMLNRFNNIDAVLIIIKRRFVRRLRISVFLCQQRTPRILCRQRI